MMTAVSDSSPADAPAPIVARAGRYYRWTRYIISIGLLIGVGGWFIYDGFIAWPAARSEGLALIAQGREPKVKPRTDLEILLNQLIGVTLPPLGVALLAWTLYNSRGAYRLEDNVLYVPGHPPVPLDAITRLDKRLLDRKGILSLDYQLADGAGEKTGRLKLDDFVYDQDPTDAIIKQVERSFMMEEEATSDALAEGPSTAEGSPTAEAPPESADSV